MNKPIVIDGDSFQKIWSSAVQYLSQNQDCQTLCWAWYGWTNARGVRQSDVLGHEMRTNYSLCFCL